MLKIEKLKDQILNYDNSDDFLECWLYQITTNSYDNKNSCSNSTCSECLKISLLKLLEEYKEPIKLTRLEYGLLNIAKKEGFNFIARDGDGRLFLYKNALWKGELAWNCIDENTPLFTNLFKFVKWEDEVPYNIDEILSNCEVMQDE